MSMYPYTRLLIAESNEEDYYLFRYYLSTGLMEHELTWAKDNKEFLSYLDSQQFDAIIVDYCPDNVNGGEQLKIASSRNAFTPVIALCEKAGPEIQLEAIRKGAADCLAKNNLSSDTIEHALRCAMERYVHFQKLQEEESCRSGLGRMSATGRTMMMISHELKNPLARIFLSVEQAGDLVTDNEEAAFYIDMIRTSAKEVDELLNKLNKATRFELQLQKQNLVDVVKESVSLASPQVQLKSIRVLENYPDESIEVELDKEKLKTALLNLITNAVEAIDKNEGLIEIKLEKRNNRATIVIKDSGSGMSQEVLENMYTPFYSQKSNYSGLGLTAAQQIVFGHKGTIEASSERGAGAEFRVGFPIAAA